jgi:hypothetical protein
MTINKKERVKRPKKLKNLKSIVFFEDFSGGTLNFL